MIAQSIYTPSLSQKKFFSIDPSNFIVSSVNGVSLEQIDGLKSKSLLSDLTIKGIRRYPLEEEPIYNFSNHEKKNLIRSLFNNREKQLEELKNKIYNIYDRCQKENWDGYEAEPIKYLFESLQFAEDLFSESRVLIESVDIIPENDGCLCFEWFKSNSKYINISVKKNKLIYTYKLGNDKNCGESTYSGKQMIINQIKKIA